MATGGLGARINHHRPGTRRCLARLLDNLTINGLGALQGGLRQLGVARIAYSVVIGTNTGHKALCPVSILRRVI
jgi:hypothetical protein